MLSNVRELRRNLWKFRQYAPACSPNCATRSRRKATVAAAYLLPDFRETVAPQLKAAPRPAGPLPAEVEQGLFPQKTRRKMTDKSGNVFNPSDSTFYFCHTARKIVEIATLSDELSYSHLVWNKITILQHFLFCKWQRIQECLHWCFSIATVFVGLQDTACSHSDQPWSGNSQECLS